MGWSQACAYLTLVIGARAHGLGVICTRHHQLHVLFSSRHRFPLAPSYHFPLPPPIPGVYPSSGVLIHGPPGTGKTTLALALAAATGLHAIVINAATIRSKLVGASETALARLVAQARAARPCLLLLDQLEALAPAGVS